MSDSALEYAVKRVSAEIDRKRFVRLRRAGNAVAVTIPRVWLEDLGWKAGDYLILDRIFSKIVVDKARTEVL